MLNRTAKIDEIYWNALQIDSPERRIGYLSQTCGTNLELRGQVEKLLGAHAKAGEFLEQPLGFRPFTPGELPGDRPGTRIGPYELMEQIGEGGFGVVFLAEQSDPVRRKVALKILKPGMDTRQVIGRFEAERQALALMDHPNIAKVFDGGATPAGRPYFVMELVQGIPITAFCDRHQLTPRQRLELFLPVCHAVQHSHHKGIIHRDLKPSNVLVVMNDTLPVPKVIDFGIAKAMGQALTDHSVVTGFGQMVGTPMYMSPEQAKAGGLDVDTRSDIYSLGAIMYELLTGTTPFAKNRFQSADYEQILRIVREEDPPRPSTRVTTLADASMTSTISRKCDLRQLGQMMRGELDWIVMKALDKDRNRRYGSALGLAQDIERFLRDEAVEACPPSSWYRVGKCVRRNRAALRTSALVLFFLILLGIGTGWVTWERSARLAHVKMDVRRALSAAREFQRNAQWSEARAAGERAKALTGSDAVGGELRQSVQVLLADLQMVAGLETARLLGSGVRGGRFDGEAEDRGYAQAFRDYGIDVEALSNAEVAMRVKASSIRIQLATALDGWSLRRKWLATDSSYRKSRTKSWRDLMVIAKQADPDVWRCALRDAALNGDIKTLARHAHSDNIGALPPVTVVLLAQLLANAGKLEDATALLLAIQPRYADDFWVNEQLGLNLVSFVTPQWERAIPFYTAAVALRPESPGARLNLANALAATGKWEEALSVFRKALELKPDYAEAHANTGRVFWNLGRSDAAIASCRRALELNPNLAQAHGDLAGILADSARYDEAILAGQRALALRPNCAASHYYLGKAQAGIGRPEAAEQSMRAALSLKPTYAAAHSDLGVLLQRQGRSEEALAEFQLAIEANADLFPAHHNRGLALQSLHRNVEAIAAFERVIKLKPDCAAAYYDLANSFAALKQYTEAIAAYLRAIELKPDYAEAYCNLAEALREQGEFAQSLVAMEHGHRLGSLRPDWNYPSEQWVRECRELCALNPLSDVPVEKTPD